MHFYLTNKKADDISDTYRGLKYGWLKRIIVKSRIDSQDYRYRTGDVISIES